MSVITPHNFINDYSSTLAAGYTAGGTSLSLTSATGTNGLTLPTSNFVLKIEDEYFLVTIRNGTTCTVTHSYAGSTNANHSNGSVVTGCWILPAVLDDLRYGNRDLFGPKPFGTKGGTAYKQQVVTAGSSFDILPTVNGSGYIDSFRLGCEGDPDKWQVSVTVDGEGTPGINLVSAENFFALLKHPTKFFSKYFSRDEINPGTGGVTIGATFLPIPFSTSIKLTAKNVGSQSYNLWSQVTYNTNVTNNFPYSQKLQCLTGSSTGRAFQDVVTLIDTDFNKKGRLFGIHIAVDTTNASDKSKVLEGPVKIYLDGAGSATIASSALEDWFMMSYYFAATTPPAIIGDNIAFLRKGSASPYIWSMFRLHPDDPIVFQDALKITVDCGFAGYSFTGTVDFFWTIWYYLET